MTRYVRKDARIYAFSLCKLCGTAGSCDSDGCRTTTCLWCRTPQCSANGGARGTCAVCYHGFLPNWSGCHAGQACAYKGCTQPAVGRFPRKGRACADHGAHILGDGYLPKRLEERERMWHPVETDK